jgi:hypothetical protein
MSKHPTRVSPLDPAIDPAEHELLVRHLCDSSLDYILRRLYLIQAACTWEEREVRFDECFKAIHELAEDLVTTVFELRGTIRPEGRA